MYHCNISKLCVGGMHKPQSAVLHKSHNIKKHCYLISHLFSIFILAILFSMLFYMKNISYLLIQ